MGKNNASGGDFDSSWIPVIIMLCIFWPVGLYMLYKKLKELSDEKRTVKRRKSVTTVGWLLLGLGAFQMIFRPFRSVLTMVFSLLGGAALLGVGKTMKDKESLYRKYVAVTAGRVYIDIGEVAAAIPTTFEKACQDLQNMIDEGYFGNFAYLDRQRLLLVLDSRRFGEKASVKPVRPVEPVRPQPAVEPARQAAPVEPAPESGETAMTKEFKKKLAEIRRVNEEIEDEKVSQQIYRIEEVTKNIFELVQKRPEKLNQIRTFMNYYLPTTLKLLDAYSQLEDQTVQGANIVASKENIEKMLTQLVWAFEQQLDQMFEADALDISSDIKVLERMMAKDGLSESPYNLPKMRPAGGAAQARAPRERE